MVATQFCVDAQYLWKGFHWAFFINIQALIICLQRFEKNVAIANFAEAKTELETAADLMLASGAAMELASSFSQHEYQNQIRPSMAPPHVKSQDFSGLMSWEHAALIQIWRRLQPVFKALPAQLQPQHERFINAYVELASSHKAVCQKFGGGDMSSLRCNQHNAVETLDRFTQNRLNLIAPARQSISQCPFH